MDKNPHLVARRRNLLIAFVVVAIIACLPLVVKDVYAQNVLILTLMYAALSQSWNILSGYCGQISLGHALYFGAGAYVTELLFTKFGVLPWFGMIAGGFVAATIAAAVGYPCFRLKGHYFVIATIVIAEAGYLLVLNWDYAGAAMGIEIPVRGDSWEKFQFVRTKLPYIYFALALAFVAWLVTWAIEEFEMGLLVARGEGQCRRRPKASASWCSARKWRRPRCRRSSPRSAAASTRNSCRTSIPKA